MDFVIEDNSHEDEAHDILSLPLTRTGFLIFYSDFFLANISFEGDCVLFASKTICMEFAMLKLLSFSL